MSSILDVLDRPHRGTRPPRRRRPIPERISELSQPDASGCILWTGNRGSAGYAQICVSQAGYKRVTISVHRAVYELTKGRIPDGLVIDHLCRVRHCVNPDHLEAVTSRENVMRSPIALGALNAVKTHCPQGHAYSPENTAYYERPGMVGRLCKTCQRAHARRNKAQRKARVSA